MTIAFTAPVPAKILILKSESIKQHKERGKYWQKEGGGAWWEGSEEYVCLMFFILVIASSPNPERRWIQFEINHSPDERHRLFLLCFGAPSRHPLRTKDRQPSYSTSITLRGCLKFLPVATEN